MELHKHQLSDDEWKVLDIIHQILAVNFIAVNYCLSPNYCLQVPHAFQQKLSANKIPTLALEIPSFQRIVGVRVDNYRTIMKTIMGMIMRTIIMEIIIIDYNHISDSRGAYTIMVMIMNSDYNPRPNLFLHNWTQSDVGAHTVRAKVIMKAITSHNWTHNCCHNRLHNCP